MEGKVIADHVLNEVVPKLIKPLNKQEIKQLITNYKKIIKGDNSFNSVKTEYLFDPYSSNLHKLLA